MIRYVLLLALGFGVWTVAIPSDPRVVFTGSDGRQIVIRNSADPDNAPFITTTSIPNATEGQACSVTIETQAGVGREPFTWSIRGGSVPTGSSLNTATGSIHGTCSEAGVFNFTVRVEDALGGAHERAFTWTVDAADTTTAHLWVDTNGGTCTRSSSPATYTDASACSSFANAVSAATTGDTIRIKAGTYGLQGTVGASGKVLALIGEDGTTVDSGTTNPAYTMLSICHTTTLDNVDAAGDYPLVQMCGTGPTWKNSTLTEGRELRSCTSDEPLLIQSETLIANVTLENVIIETQKAHPTCDGGGPFHLEQVRIGNNVNGVLFDRVTFKRCPSNMPTYAGCGSGNIFITTPNTGTVDPTNIVLRNSICEGGESYCIQVHENVQSCDYEFYYNTFLSGEPIAMSTSSGQGLGCYTGNALIFTGNLGPRPQTCHPGATYIKNVWQWSTGTACGTDTRVAGSNSSFNQLGLNATTFRLEAGSVAIDAAESTCAASADGEDIDGEPRPESSACDAGADEYTGAELPPALFAQLRQVWAWLIS